MFLIAGCCAYVAVSFTAIVLPAQTHLVNRVALPLVAVAELPIWLWLLMKGAEVPAAARVAPRQELAARA